MFTRNQRKHVYARIAKTYVYAEWAKTCFRDPGVLTCSRVYGKRKHSRHGGGWASTLKRSAERVQDILGPLSRKLAFCGTYVARIFLTEERL